MSGNTFGKRFKLTTYGESHGFAIGAIIDGCPAGLVLNEADIQRELDRRRPQQSRYTSQRKEKDQIEILSGIFHGKTTGTPIGLKITNTDSRPSDYDHIKDAYRPGHADLVYQQKYGIVDYRGGGRASARETAMRVAAGAIAKKYLREVYKVEIKACLQQMGSITLECNDWNEVNNNAFFCADCNQIPLLEQMLQEIIKSGDSIGSAVFVQATNVPIGLGEPVYDKLDADIASAMMSINGVKGVEIGAGFSAITQKGSEGRDEMTPQGYLSNHAGGILGGISTGQAIEVRIAFKPPSSIRIPGQTINNKNQGIEIVTNGRHDPCIGIRGVPVAESMMALCIMDHVLRYQPFQHLTHRNRLSENHCLDNVEC